jgi:hypothetical protein
MSMLDDSTPTDTAIIEELVARFISIPDQCESGEVYNSHVVEACFAIIETILSISPGPAVIWECIEARTEKLRALAKRIAQ